MDQVAFKIGDMVKVNALVMFEYDGLVKKLNRYELKDITGIIIGWTVRRTGIKTTEIDASGNWNLDSDPDDFHKVWMVVRVKKNQKYNIPFACLEEDLELIGRYQ